MISLRNLPKNQETEEQQKEEKNKIPLTSKIYEDLESYSRQDDMLINPDKKYFMDSPSSRSKDDKRKAVGVKHQISSNKVNQQ